LHKKSPFVGGKMYYRGIHLAKCFSTPCRPQKGLTLHMLQYSSAFYNPHFAKGLVLARTSISLKHRSRLVNRENIS
jgi:hypothetical protein